ncbi:murein biosynthesis integral membrane protein MurJ [Streptomyces sp. NPDC012794]|uniref:murein biosynthesis integral membrane protein MurJ n=1 Tax=Streptomyces sp. NPDC012794 TaxID=3364850 RepID=UPI0036B6B85E
MYGSTGSAAREQAPPRPEAGGAREADPAPVAAPAPAKTSVLRSGALMAAGSVVSRATGFVRSAVVLAALGAGFLGDGYTVANTIPNIIYMLLVGGALNAVFVPELVRAAKEHRDGGAAYTDRLLTACTVALLALTAAAVLAAPLIVDAYTPEAYTPAQRSTVIALARFCLPQILFYGLFTVLGQVLGARGRFGAMMWTPVLNNLVIIGVFGLFLYTSHGGRDALGTADTRLLGIGTTAGIVVQALALVPSLRAARFRWRPRFDWRGSGLTRPLRNAGWLVLLVLTNQIAYWVVTVLSTTVGHRAGGFGYAAYTSAYQLWIVPQGIITVSLVTALMPRMSSAAADGDLGAVREDVSYALRSSAALVVPAAALFAALAPWVMDCVSGYGKVTAAEVAAMAGMLTAFAPGLVAFSAQYVLARGFYALSDTRTPFFLNLVIVACNAGLSYAAYLLLPARWAVTGMAAATSLAFTAGAAVTAYALSRRLGPRTGGRTATALRTHLRLLAACLPAAAAAYGAARAAGGLGAFAAAAAGTAALALVVVLLARPLRLAEITDLLDSLRRKVRR